MLLTTIAQVQNLWKITSCLSSAAADYSSVARKLGLEDPDTSFEIVAAAVISLAVFFESSAVFLEDRDGLFESAHACLEHPDLSRQTQGAAG